MERFSFSMTVNPGAEEEDKRRHDELWPELAEAIPAAGTSNYTPLRRGLTVIGNSECVPGARTALARTGHRYRPGPGRVDGGLMEEEAGARAACRSRFIEVWHKE